MTGHPRLARADLAVDRELAAIAAKFRFLLDVTPVNAAEARRRFGDLRRTPEFDYRPLEPTLDVARERLGRGAVGGC